MLVQLDMLSSKPKDSSLFSSGNVFMLSFDEGVDMCANTFLPVFPCAHLFIQSSLVLTLSICLTVCIGVLMFGCSCLLPFLARVSALSFPGMFECPGIHCMVRGTSNRRRYGVLA